MSQTVLFHLRSLVSQDGVIYHFNPGLKINLGFNSLPHGGSDGGSQ